MVVNFSLVPYNIGPMSDEIRMKSDEIRMKSDEIEMISDDIRRVPTEKTQMQRELLHISNRCSSALS